MKYVSLLLLAFTLACSDNTNVPDSDSGLTSGYTSGRHDKSGNFLSAGIGSDYSESFEEVETAYFNTPPPPTEQAEIQQQVIKKGSLEFETSDLEATHQKIQELVATHKGIIQDDNSGKSYRKFYHNVTVRVPSDNFQAFIDGISEGVAYFDRKDISQQDVTEEFVDLEARLKAKRELENRYLELLKQAKNVKEMLEIERELSNIREEIEAKQGRLNYLKNKVSLSTITLHFYKVTSETGVTVSYGQKMKNALKGGWDGISAFFLGLLYLWPLFLLLAILIFFLRRYLRRKKKKAKN